MRFFFHHNIVHNLFTATLISYLIPNFGIKKRASDREFSRGFKEKYVTQLHALNWEKRFQAISRDRDVNNEMLHDYRR